jgi:hypothetical protein
MIIRVTIAKNHDDLAEFGEQFTLNTKTLSIDEQEELGQALATILRLRMTHVWEQLASGEDLLT